MVIVHKWVSSLRPSKEFLWFKPNMQRAICAIQCAVQTSVCEYDTCQYSSSSQLFSFLQINIIFAIIIINRYAKIEWYRFHMLCCQAICFPLNVSVYLIHAQSNTMNRRRKKKCIWKLTICIWILIWFLINARLNDVFNHSNRHGLRAHQWVIEPIYNIIICMRIGTLQYSIHFIFHFYTSLLISVQSSIALKSTSIACAVNKFMKFNQFSIRIATNTIAQILSPSWPPLSTTTTYRYRLKRCWFADIHCRFSFIRLFDSHA